VKLAEVAPAVTVTEAGTVNDARLLERATVSPPDPATLERVTVHELAPPEVRLEGLQETWLTVPGASKDKEAVCEPPL
jgi:hypothetical protein